MKVASIKHNPKWMAVDFLIQSVYHRGLGPYAIIAAATVPEPSTLALVSVFSLFLAPLRRRFRSAWPLLPPAHPLGRWLDVQPPQNTASTSFASVNRIDPNFVKRCEQELAYCIGPMANFIVEEVLEQQPSSNQELIENLAQQIPDSKKAMEFRKRLLENWSLSIWIHINCSESL